MTVLEPGSPQVHAACHVNAATPPRRRHWRDSCGCAACVPSYKSVCAHLCICPPASPQRFCVPACVPAFMSHSLPVSDSMRFRVFVSSLRDSLHFRVPCLPPCPLFPCLPISRPLSSLSLPPYPLSLPALRRWPTSGWQARYWPACRRSACWNCTSRSHGLQPHRPKHRHRHRPQMPRRSRRVATRTLSCPCPRCAWVWDLVPPSNRGCCRRQAS